MVVVTYTAPVWKQAEDCIDLSATTVYLLEEKSGNLLGLHTAIAYAEMHSTKYTCILITILIIILSYYQ